MEGMDGVSGLGGVSIITTHGRGQTPEEMADRVLGKIISVGKEAHPLIREQALEYQSQIYDVLVYYMQEMVKAEHTNVRNRLRAAGHPEAIPIALGE